MAFSNPFPLFKNGVFGPKIRLIPCLFSSRSYPVQYFVQSFLTKFLQKFKKLYRFVQLFSQKRTSSHARACACARTGARAYMCARIVCFN